MTDHENKVTLLGQVNQLLPMILPQNQWFFNIHVFAGQQTFPRKVEMGFSRRGYCDPTDVST